MSDVLSAKQICEQGLRNIGAFPVTDSAADGSQLRQAMTSLDLIMAEEAGVNKLFFLIPATLSFTLQNGLGAYDLANALGANAPSDGMQFPLKAYLLEPNGSAIVNFASAVPGTILVGQGVVDNSQPTGLPPGTTVAAINGSQITLSGPSLVASGDVLQFGATPPVQLTSTGTTNATGAVAGVTTMRRHPIEIVTRERFEEPHNPVENGRPRMVWIDRLPDNQLKIYPIPAATDSQLYILQLDVQTYAPNVAPAGVTGTQPQSGVATKFRQAWQRFLVFQLSHDLGSGPIFKISESRLNRFGKIAASARERLEAFENREHDNLPPVCEPWGYESDDHDPYFQSRVRRG